jgi:D-3-phosphoglycerate dehydrogenase
MSKVIYYNIDDNLDYENSLLKEWGVTDIELTEVKDSNRERWDECKSADGLVVEYEQLTREKLAELPNLKIVALQSIGYNNVDLAAAGEQGVYVTNIPGFCTEEVALHTVGMLIDLVRKITFLDRSVRKGKWNPFAAGKSYRIAGKTIGLVFFGNIPKAMLPMLNSLELNVLVYAPTKTREYLSEFGVTKAVTLDELLKSGDFVSLHTPLNDKTFHLIGERELSLMKPSAYLINTARGSVVDEPALIAALKNGVIAGAAVDVIEDETNETSGLFELDNTVITPHAAFVSEDSFYEGRKRALTQLVTLLSKGETPEF